MFDTNIVSIKNITIWSSIVREGQRSGYSKELLEPSFQCVVSLRYLCEFQSPFYLLVAVWLDQDHLFLSSMFGSEYQLGL